MKVGHRVYPRISIFALLFALIATASGCSLRGIAYKHADYLAMYEADKWFDLTRAQKKKISPQVTAVITRIKTERMPVVSAAILEFRGRVVYGLTKEDVVKLRTVLDRELVTTVEWLMASTAVDLASLSDSQVDHTSVLLKKSTDDAAAAVAELEKDKGVDGSHLEAWRKKRRKTMRDRLAWWIDEVGPSQEALLERHIPAQTKDQVARLSFRREGHELFLRLLGSHDAKIISDGIIGWAKDPGAGRSLAYQAALRSDRERMTLLVLDVIRSLDPHQKLVLLGRIDEIIETIARKEP